MVNTSGAIDKLDLEILRELKADARQSYRKIARKLKVATGTIQNRIQRMESEGIIEDYHACIDYSKLGFSIAAVIASCVKRKDLPKIIEKIVANPNIFGVFSVTGEYDIFMSARFKDMDGLNEFVVEELSHPSVERTVTFLVLKTHKESHTFLSEV